MNWTWKLWRTLRFKCDRWLYCLVSYMLLHVSTGFAPHNCPVLDTVPFSESEHDLVRSCKFILKPRSGLPVSCVCLDAVQTEWRQADSVSWLLRLNSRESLSHRETSPSPLERPAASAARGGAPAWRRRRSSGGSDGSGNRGAGIYLPSYLFIYCPASNGWGPWLRLLRGRCSLTLIDGVWFPGMDSARADPQAGPLRIQRCPHPSASAGGEK